MASDICKIDTMDVLGRAIEKNLSREFDQFYIEYGIASPGSLAARNDFFASLDLGSFKITSIGRRPAHSVE